jgi:hypothetical protein
LELLFPHYNTFVTPQVFQMMDEGTVGAPTCLTRIQNPEMNSHKLNLNYGIPPMGLGGGGEEEEEEGEKRDL